MSDLISRQAAIDAIEKYDFSFPEYMERFVTELRDAMKEDLKDDIANLPSAQPEQRWIPVTERLPDKNGKYLCSIQSNFKRKKIMRISTTDFESGINRWSPDCMAFKDRVIAWMPLPAPYVNEEPPTDGCYGCKHRIIRSMPTSKFYCDLDDAFHDNLTNCPLEQDAPSASELRGEMYWADQGDEE